MSAPSAKTPQGKPPIVGAAATLAALGAVVCGACCVLPFALPAAVLAVTGGTLAWFGRMQGWATGLAALAVIGAWIWVGAQSWRTRRRPATSTLLTLTGASLALAVALAWPWVEAAILRGLA